MSIFIQIAAQRDPQLKPTVEDCIAQAEHPELLVFGICNQYHTDDPFHDLSCWDEDPRFRIVNVPQNQARGACWARHEIQKMQQNETQTLQIDSHMRFVKHWDTLLKDMLLKLQEKSPKPLLTAYVCSFDPDNDPKGRVHEAWRMAQDKFTPEGCVFFLPEVIPGWSSLKEPIRARFQSAHFAFTLGQFCKEVPHDPNQQFHGEEISIAVRAYTWGQDLQHPHIIVCYHEQTRKNRTKQWDDDKEWWRKNEACHKRNRELLCVDEDPFNQKPKDFGPQGLGTVRSIRDYERYAGLCFGTRKFHPFTMSHRDPPDASITHLSDKEWLDSFDNKIRIISTTSRLTMDCTPRPTQVLYSEAYVTQHLNK